MPVLAFLLPAWKWAAGFVSSLLSTEFGRLCLAVIAAFLAGDWHAAHSARIAREKAALEARIDAQSRDLRVANEIAVIAQSQARDADAARADALRAIEEIKANAKPNCLLSPADVDRLRRAGR